ncbi:MAG: hypothetical protein Q8P67_07955 [archaeon]|nr:hypothetical protein [archaeon]
MAGWLMSLVLASQSKQEMDAEELYLYARSGICYQNGTLQQSKTDIAGVTSGCLKTC